MLESSRELLLFASWPVSLPVAAPGLSLAVVGAVLLGSADMVRLAEVMGVAAVLSTKASESVVSTAMAIPAPEPGPGESALDEMFVLTLEVIETLPVAVMSPVPDSWLLALASTWATVTE